MSEKTNFISTSCVSGGENTHAHRWCPLDFPTAGNHRRTRCDDVINHENVAVAEHFWLRQREDAFHVFPALRSRLVRLALLEMSSLNDFVKHGNTRHAADAVGNGATLVVAALSHSAPREGNGNQRVDTFEKRMTTHLLRRHATDEMAYFLLIVVFQMVDDGAMGCRGLVEKPRRSAFNGKMSPEEPCHRVVDGLFGVVGARQRQQAVQTGRDFRFAESVATGST